MSKLEEREAKALAAKRKSFVQTMVENNESIEETKAPVEKNIQRSYYLSEDLLRAIAFKSADELVDKSQIVRDALEMYLADILTQIRKKKAE